MGIRETLFQDRFPQFTEQQAAAFYGKHGEMVSVCARPGAPDLFLVALASEKESYGPLALNPIVARALCKLLMDAGYAPPLRPLQN